MSAQRMIVRSAIAGLLLAVSGRAKPGVGRRGSRVPVTDAVFRMSAEARQPIASRSA